MLMKDVSSKGMTMYKIQINDPVKDTELILTQADLDQEVKVKARVEAEAEAGVVVIEVDLVNAVIHVIED